MNDGLLSLFISIYLSMLIGVLGRKGSGKDTVSDYVVKKFNFEKMTLAEPLKNACKELFNFSDEQLYGDLKETIDPQWEISPRKVLQWLGTDVIRNRINELNPNIGNNFWVMLLRIKYLQKLSQNKIINVIVSDVRFQNEIDMIHQLGGKVIKLTRPSINNADAHESEKNIDNLKGDIDIINDSTLDELYKNVDEIFQ